MPYDAIILGTDGSDFAARAERSAVHLAGACRAFLLIAQVTNGARNETGRAAAVAEEATLKPEVRIESGPPVERLVSLAQRENADLVVLGSRGLSQGAPILGGVANGVVNEAPCDVLLVGNEPSGVDRPYERILIATDGSPTADRAARRGLRLAARLEAEPILIFVGHPKTGAMVLDDTVATFEGDAGSPSLIVEHGEPAETIMAVAQREGAGLIVIGNRGMTGARARMLGSVPRTIARSAPRDVLVVRTVSQSLEEIQPGRGGIVDNGDRKVAVFRDAAGIAHAVSPKCTHMECTVGWNGSEQTWDCPCHGSRYASDGTVIHGPAKRNLDPVEL